jgi:hypothetical protein
VSRIVYFALSGAAAGEIQADCSRSWAINAGSETVIILGAGQIAGGLNFGRLILVEHERLPAWAGVIDTPWRANLPAEMTVYSAEYLLQMRCPDAPQLLVGTTGDIAQALLEMASGQELLPIVPGDIEEDGEQEEPIDQRPVWEQLREIVDRRGMELRMRPQLLDGQIVIYMDIRRRLGIDTQFLLHDGEGANLEVVDASIESEIHNRVIAIGDQATQAARIVSRPWIDELSIKSYRLRSNVIQVSGPSQSSLEQAAKVEMEARSRPILRLEVNALDVGETYAYLDLGNILLVHASRVYLPRGVVVWRGPMRITTMTYDEPGNRVNMTLEGYL